MPQVTRKIEFDAGHRVLGHEGKCAHLHGHRYVAEVTVKSLGLDSISRVVDFSVVKKLVGDWVDENWDHNILLNQNDPLILMWEELYGVNTGDKKQTHEWRREVFGGRQPFIVPNNQNPTAEVIAKLLFEKATELMTLAGAELYVYKVRIYETPNCWADYSMQE